MLTANVDSKGRLDLGTILTPKCQKKVHKVKVEFCLDDDCGALLITLFDKKGKQIEPELQGGAR